LATLIGDLATLGDTRRRCWGVEQNAWRRLGDGVWRRGNAWRRSD